MLQLALDLPQKRRIDITFERLDEMTAGMNEEERAKFAEQRFYPLLITASRLRSMEMAEEAAMGGKRPRLADDYDRLVQPGEPAVEAILRTLTHHLSREA